MSEVLKLMNWQQDFIATNLLAIGYNAWVRYLSGERGGIICSRPTSSKLAESYAKNFLLSQAQEFNRVSASKFLFRFQNNSSS